MSRGNQKPWEPNMRAVLKQRVASLLAKGLAEHEIVQRLCADSCQGLDGEQHVNTDQIINPRTDKPYSQVTINRIKRELHAEWRRCDAKTISQHYGRLIVENYEARRAAWSVGDIDGVRKLLDQMAGWIGANAPTKVDLNIGNIDAAIESELARLAGLAQAGDAGEAEGETDAGAAGDSAD